MSNPEPAKEFLLEEYKYFQELLWKNEAMGETRVNFFVTIATAVLGGTIALVTSQVKPEQKLFLDNIPGFTFKIVTVVLFSLLLLGWVTLSRLIERNSKTDGYKKDMDKIRQRFRDYFDDANCLEHYLPFTDDFVSRMNSTSSTKHGRTPGASDSSALRKLGGLAYIVAAMNSIVVAGIVASIIPAAPIWLFVACLIGSMWLHSVWIRRKEHESNLKLYRHKITHAGGVVYAQSEGVYKFLLTTSTNDANEWVFPKGHIEGKESHNDAAVREVLEETGFLTRTLRPLGVNEFPTKDKTGEVICKYYLMECIDPAHREMNEPRQIQWLTYNEARVVMQFADARQLLDKANYLLGRVTNEARATR